MATNNALNVQGATPAFKATSSGAGNCTGDGTYYYIVASSAAYYDYCNNWNSDTFTADRDGIYIFTGVIEISDLDAAHTQGAITFVHNGNKIIWGANPYAINITTQNNLRIPFSFQERFASGETLRIFLMINLGTKTITVGNGTFIQGSLLFAV